MLDTLASKRALEEAAADGSQPGLGKRTRKGPSYDINSFNLISLELAKNADLKTDGCDGKRDVHSRKMTLKFIFVTPRQLIEKEGKEIKQTRVDLYVPSGSKYDLIGHKEDFRVNMQFSMSTGMIGEDLCHDSDLAQQSVSLCDDETMPVPQPRPEPIIEEPLTTQPDEPDQDPFEPAGVDDDPFDAVPDQPTSPSPEFQDEVIEAERPKRRDKLADICNEPKAPIADPWEPLTPQEVAETTPKRKRRPIKKGRTTKMPPDLNVEKKNKRHQRRQLEGNAAKLKVDVPVEQFLIRDLTKGAIFFNGGGDAQPLPEFKDIKKSKFKQTEPEPESDAVAAAAAATDDASADDAPPDDAPPDDDGWNDIQVDAADLGDDEPEPARPPTAEDGEEDVNPDSYEQLVIKRVAAYVAQSQDYVESTDLAKRVARWHESIGPRLEEVEKRGNFDIHDYGSRILESFPEDSRKTTLNFSQITKGHGKEEVARLFLSSLMLANTYNIELRSETHQTEAMDDIELVLLSKTRHHENMFDSPPPPAAEQSKRKRKAK